MNGAEGKHFLVTNAMKPRAMERIASPSLLSEADLTSLSQLSLSALAFLARSVGAVPTASAQETATRIGDRARIEAKIDHEANLQPPVAATNAIVPAMTPPDAAVVPLSRADLMKKKVDELKVILRQKNLKSPTKKAEMVDLLLRANNVKSNELEEAKRKLVAAKTTIIAPHHSHYRNTFNAIDLHDRFWNKRQDHHALRFWRSKFIISLLQSGMINAWVLCSQSTPITFETYCQSLTQKLFDFLK